MVDIIDLALYRKGDDLSELTDPCSGCDDKPTCKDTCTRAHAWWDQFITKFRER